MSSYNSYPAYKNSGIEWIGEVPDHWEIKPLKISVTHNDDVIPDSTHPEELIKYVDISSVSYNEGISKAEEMVFGDAPSRARRKAKVGDVIVSTVRTYLKAVASVDKEFADCTFSTGFAVLRSRPKKIEPKFLKWLVLNDLFIQSVEAHSEGLSYPAINPSTLVALKTALPSIEEQKKIAFVIETETSRINSLIAKKTRFIKLLKEKRQAFITHAVTKGINPDVHMKDSGVEWIGEVPEHWEVKRLRHVAVFNNSNVDKKSYDDQNEVKLCNYTDVYYNEFITSDLEFMTATANDAEIQKFRLKKGDVIITKDSEDPRDIGIPALVSEDMDNVICGYHLTVIKAHEPNLSGFIHRSIQSLSTKAHFFVESPGITRYGLDQDAIGDIRICVPPQEERAPLTKAINQETSRIDKLIEFTQCSIELLKERRSAFITAAVTGMIDVRNKQESIRE